MLLTATPAGTGIESNPPASSLERLNTAYSYRHVPLPLSLALYANQYRPSPGTSACATVTDVSGTFAPRPWSRHAWIAGLPRNCEPVGVSVAPLPVFVTSRYDALLLRLPDCASRVETYTPSAIHCAPGNVALLMSDWFTWQRLKIASPLPVLYVLNTPVQGFTADLGPSRDCPPLYEDEYESRHPMPSSVLPGVTEQDSA